MVEEVEAHAAGAVEEVGPTSSTEKMWGEVADVIIRNCFAAVLTNPWTLKLTEPEVPYEANAVRFTVAWSAAVASEVLACPHTVKLSVKRSNPMTGEPEGQS
jgi:hypothetical protein